MKRTTLVLLALLLLGFGWRVWNLGGQSVWWDEAFTFQTTSHGLANLWHMLQTGDRNPPLYFLSAALWGDVAGWSEFSLRFVSVFWGVVGLAFLTNLVKQLFGRNASVWALGVAVVSPALVVYAQEARMYATFFALTAATLYLGLRVLDLGPADQHTAIHRQKSIWPFWLCEALLLLTHYFALPLIVTVNLFALFRLFQRPATAGSVFKWIGGQLMVMLPLALWLLGVLATPGNLVTPGERPPDVLTFIYQSLTLWISGVRDLSGAQIALVLPAVGVIILAAIGAWLAHRQRAELILTFGLVLLGVSFAFTRALTAFHPRYLLPYFIPWLALIGGASASVTTRARSVRAGWRQALSGLTLLGTVTLVAGGWTVASDPQYAKDDARSVAAYLRQNAGPADVILLEANDYTLSYYDHGPAATRMITATTESDALQQLSTAIGAARRVWLPHWTVSTQDPRGYWRFLLEQSGQLIDWMSFHGYEVYGYDMQTAVYPPALSAEMPASSGMAVRWSGVEEQRADGALAFAIEWHPPVTYFEPASVSVRLTDPGGERISTVDAPLRDEAGRTTDRWAVVQPVTNYYVLPLPPGTPPGTYTLTAQVYNRREVLGEQSLGAVQIPRRLDTADPYRTLAGYRWQKPLAGDALPGLVLEAASLPSTSAGVPPLGVVDVTLRWRRTGSSSNIAPQLRLVQGDRVWVNTRSNLFEHDYPVAHWVEGETVLDRRQFSYPPLRGETQLQVGQGDHWIDLATLSLDESQLKFDPPSIPHAQSAQFGNFAQLLGYGLKTESFAAERPLELKLYWRAINTEPITTAYTIFTQVIAPDGHLVAQHDAPPRPPALAWVPGQIVEDEHLIHIVDPAYRGPGTLIVGWYNSATVARIPVEGGGDFVTLQTPVRIDEK